MSVSANGNVQLMMDRLRDLIRASNTPDVELTVDDDGHFEEGQWVYFIVDPAKPGVRAMAYVERLQELEKRLREEFGPNIMLVPARGD